MNTKEIYWVKWEVNIIPNELCKTMHANDKRGEVRVFSVKIAVGAPKN